MNNIQKFISIICIAIVAVEIGATVYTGNFTHLFVAFAASLAASAAMPERKRDERRRAPDEDGRVYNKTTRGY